MNYFDNIMGVYVEIVVVVFEVFFDELFEIVVNLGVIVGLYDVRCDCICKNFCEE